jgi:hypothetical protein
LGTPLAYIKEGGVKGEAIHHTQVHGGALPLWRLHSHHLRSDLHHHRTRRRRTRILKVFIIIINTVSIIDPSSHLVVIQTIDWIDTCVNSFICSSMYSIMMMLISFICE